MKTPRHEEQLVSPFTSVFDGPEGERVVRNVGSGATLHALRLSPEYYAANAFSVRIHAVRACYVVTNAL